MPVTSTFHEFLMVVQAMCHAARFTRDHPADISEHWSQVSGTSQCHWLPVKLLGVTLRGKMTAAKPLPLQLYAAWHHCLLEWLLPRFKILKLGLDEGLPMGVPPRFIFEL